MENDITIRNIISVYYCQTDKWERNFFASRTKDGIVFFTEGEIEYWFENKKLVARKGDFIFLPGNIPYSGRKISESVAFFVIDFSCNSENEFSQIIQPTVFHTRNYDRTAEKLEGIIDVWNKQRIDMNFKIKSFIYSVLSDILKNEHSEQSLSLTDTMLDYICENISSTSLSVKALCQKFYISESQLRRNILKQTGMTPNEYIMNLRINIAKSELTYTSKSITDIATCCGFSSAYYFSNFFSKHTGTSPLKFRKNSLNMR